MVLLISTCFLILLTWPQKDYRIKNVRGAVLSSQPMQGPEFIFCGSLVTLHFTCLWSLSFADNLSLLSQAGCSDFALILPLKMCVLVGKLFAKLNAVVKITLKWRAACLPRDATGDFPIFRDLSSDLFCDVRPLWRNTMTWIKLSHALDHVCDVRQGGSSPPGLTRADIFTTFWSLGSVRV